MNEITKAEIRKRLGNITQLQELLFGEQIDEYNHKLEQYSQKINQIEANSQKFQQFIEERITQLEKKQILRLNSVANALEKKIKYVNIVAQQEQAKIQEELNSISQHSYKNIDLLQNSINDHKNSLKTEIIETKSDLEQDLQQLKQQIFEKLESNILELSTNKISRSDLAEVLFELCLKLKDTDVNMEFSNCEENLTSSESNHAHSDLILSKTKES